MTEQTQFEIRDSASGKTAVALRSRAASVRNDGGDCAGFGRYRAGAGVAGVADGRGADGVGLQPVRLRPFGNEPGRDDRAHDRGDASGYGGVAGPLLREQFQECDRPRLLTLARGQANVFKKEFESGIDFLRRRIPQVFEGEPFQRQKTRIVERFTLREKELMDDFTRRIAREQFALGRMQVGAVALPEIFPVIDGQMVPIEEIPKMVQDGKLESKVAEDLERKYDQFRQEFTVVYRKTLSLSRELASEMSYLEQEAASVLVDGVIEELKEKYPSPQIAEYLEEVRHHVLDNLEPFKEREGEDEQAPPEGAAALERSDPTAIHSACTEST